VPHIIGKKKNWSSRALLLFLNPKEPRTTWREGGGVLGLYYTGINSEASSLFAIYYYTVLCGAVTCKHFKTKRPKLLPAAHHTILNHIILIVWCDDVQQGAALGVLF
jgi:hypothetical protein